MSSRGESTSLLQLAESYSNILAATLKNVRETGILRDAKEVLDELECRWRASVGKALEDMEARQAQVSGGAPGGRRGPSIATLITGSSPSQRSLQAEGRFDGAPSFMPEALRKRPPGTFDVMQGLTFAEPFELPALDGRPPVPALECSDGFRSSNLETPSGLGALGQLPVGAVPLLGVAQPEVGQPQKRARKGQRETSLVQALERPLAPPLDAAGPPRPEAAVAAAAPGVAPLPPAVAQDEAEDDESYDGCFEGAEVIVSSVAKAAEQDGQAGGEEERAVVPADGLASPLPGSDGRPESSQGSELGSDFDDSEWGEASTENVLHAKVARITKQKGKQWTLRFEEGVLTIDGVECLFKSGRGLFTVEEPDNAEALEDEGAADKGGDGEA